MDIFLLVAVAALAFFGLRRSLQRIAARLGEVETSHKSLSRAFDDLHAAYYRRTSPGGGAQDIETGPAVAAAPAPPEATGEVPAPPSPAGDEATPLQPEMPPTSVPALPGPGQEPGGAPPQSGAGLEEQLGTRWAVWVGGVALALGGILLVRYSIEQGFFGPGLRIACGALLAALLIGAGEWFRRTDTSIGIEVIPSAHIPGVLTAAGTITGFGTIYAAHALYAFIGPTVAFILLGLAGIATMLAAAVHGPALAGLGLAGALVTPLLVSSEAPSPWPVVVYLGVVAASAYALARLRQWLWLAACVAVGVFLWGVVLTGPLHLEKLDWSLAAKAHALLHLVLAGFFLALEPNAGTRDEEAWPDWIGSAALALLTVLAIIVLGSSRFDFGSWTLFAAVCMIVLAAIGWLSAPVAAATLLAGVVGVSALLLWPGLKAPIPATLLAPEVAEVLRLPEHITSYLTFGAISLLALSACAGLRLMRGSSLPVPTAAFYAGAATLPALLGLVVAYLRVTQFDRSIPFACFGAALAAIYAIAAEHFHRAEGDAPTAGQRLATGAFAAAAIAAASFALVAALDRGYLTVALALSALGTAYVATLKDIPLLRQAVGALGLVVLARLAWNPRVMGADVGSWPILNWLLLGYGVPAVAFAVASRLLRARADDFATRMCDALAVVFSGLLAYFQIRHLLNDGDVLSYGSGHMEQGLLAFMGVAFSYVLMRLDLARANPVFRAASYVFAILSVLHTLGGLCLFNNPYLSGERVRGAVVFSSLMVGYLLPGLAALFVARQSRGIRPGWFVTMIGLMAMLLIFAYVTLEVRHGFLGERIGFLRATSEAEVWAYSIAWLGLGIVLLGYGIWRGSREARLVSAALVVLSVLKAFLWDLSELENPWRALSFIVLGLVLIGIGLLYQRVVFARPASPAPPAIAPAEPPPA